MYPVLSVARSPLKDCEDHLVGRSIVFSTDALVRARGDILTSRSACVIGFGKIGRSIAQTLRAQDLRVPVYDNDAVKREIDKLATAIPHHELAIQFDVASAVFARLERNEASSYGRTKAEMQETFAKIVVDLGNHVPADVDLLYHLCYGDFEHTHRLQPPSLAVSVDIANAIAAAVRRPIGWVHMPVPRDRHDDAYFAPLHDLQMHPETKLYLGLVHHTDGVEGTRKRMQTASRYVSDYGIATECGWGRRPKETLPALLRIHTEAADLP